MKYRAMSTDSDEDSFLLQGQVTETEEEETIFTLATLQFPEITSQLRRFQHLSRKQRTLAAEIDRLEDKKDHTDEELAALATEIREYIS